MNLLLNILFLILITGIGGYLLHKFVKKYTLSYNLIIPLLAYHLFFCILYYIGFLIGPGDYLFYFDSLQTGKFFSTGYHWGTQFVIFFYEPLANLFQLSLFSLFMLAQWLGFFGILFFYISIKEHLKKEPFWLPYLLFLPNLHIWTVALGKDSFIFLGIGLLFYAVNNLKKRKTILGIALFIIFHIRPHVFLLILIVLAFFVFFFSQRKLAKVGVIIFLILGVIVAFPFLNQQLDGDFSREGISYYWEYRQETNSWGGSSFALAEMNIVYGTFSYLYRPLFYDVQTPMQLGASLENFFYLIITLSLLRPSFFKFLWKRRRTVTSFHALYFIGMTLLLGTVSANLGLATRQKMMFLPSLLLLFVFYYAEKHKLLRKLPNRYT